MPPLTDDAIEILVEHAARQTSPLSYCITFQLGGAMSRVPEQAMAFSQRDDSHNVNITSVWTADDPDPNRHIDWARRFSDALTPLSHERVYVNFLGNEVTDRVRSAYGEPNYHRLATIKASWDPTNFLRGNHNITPLSA